MNAQLDADAEALDREAGAAEYLAGLARQGGEGLKAADIEADAAIMRRWADLNRAISAASE